MAKRKADRRKRGLDKLNNFLGEKKEKGLNPVDLLTKLSKEQRQIINWMARRKRSTLRGVVQGLELEVQTAVERLNDLKEAGYIRETFIDGILSYRVVFGGRTGQLEEGLPKDIWARVDLDRVPFLRRLPLFEQLPEDVLRKISDQLKSSSHARGDVIFWQGEEVKNVYFIRSGIIGISVLHGEGEQNNKVLAHLRQGDILGEYSLLSGRGGMASATATALSAVNLLYMPHDKFMSLLQEYQEISIGIARMLVERIIDMNPKRDGSDVRLSLVFGNGPQQEVIGQALTAMLARDNQSAYTEYPAPRNLVSRLGIDYKTDEQYYSRPGKFDVVIPQSMPSLPMTVRMTLMWDQLSERYSNIVIGVPPRVDNSIAYLLERASQVLMVIEPTKKAVKDALALRQKLSIHTHPEQTAVFTLALRLDESQADLPAVSEADFDIPYVPDLQTAVQAVPDEYPAALATVVGSLADRLGRTNQISVYIPTTVDVDAETDTTVYVERTLNLLGELFGGATSSQAQGVWNSAESGLVGETVHIVRSYATVAALNAHLPRVLTYVEEIKEELRQEAMAIEVNQKLMLI